MKMKIMNITNIDKFFGAIDQCEGKVELITKNGDVYNLKSKLSQFVSFTKIYFFKNKFFNFLSILILYYTIFINYLLFL